VKAAEREQLEQLRSTLVKIDRMRGRRGGDARYLKKLAHEAVLKVPVSKN
jgi:hypothetical protein